MGREPLTAPRRPVQAGTPAYAAGHLGDAAVPAAPSDSGTRGGAVLPPSPS
ncbi:hypothetical protein [Actinomadura sp. NBRC 104425]|uniref:hypothetical protein n=1 Tax=Actinomadura sp. NBRC 104425 TaxID=3032204 RepID=UPI002554C02E|nr:hypothetical protein [Actinomadura sp. NBRC 104425]